MRPRRYLPVGYFFINSVTSSQKAALLKHCLHLLKTSGVIVSNVTFDGCPTNVSILCKILGCNFDYKNLKSSFLYDDEVYCVMPDPSHMIILIRNAFVEQKSFLDVDDKSIT